MKIIYANEELKKICKDKQTKLNPERILKCFEDILGEKITVLESSFSNTKHTLKVENMEEDVINSIYEVNIEKLFEGHPLALSNTVNFLVSIGETDELFPISDYKTFIVNEYIVQKVSHNIYNKKSKFMIKCSEPAPNRIDYILLKDNIECHFSLNRTTELSTFKFLTNEMITFQFLKIESLTLNNIYNFLKELNEINVLDITITLTNKQTKETEKIVIENGDLISYEKSYLKDDKIIKLVYQNDQLEVIESKKISEEELEINQFNVTEDIEKVKKLVNK